MDWAPNYTGIRVRVHHMRIWFIDKHSHLVIYLYFSMSAVWEAAYPGYRFSYHVPPILGFFS